MKTRFTAPPLPLAPSRLHIEAVESAAEEDPVARGKRLAADPDYPSFQICQKIAEAWLSSVPSEKPRATGRGWVGARG